MSRASARVVWPDGSCCNSSDDHDRHTRREPAGVRRSESLGVVLVKRAEHNDPLVRKRGDATREPDEGRRSDPKQSGKLHVGPLTGRGGLSIKAVEMAVDEQQSGLGTDSRERRPDPEQQRAVPANEQRPTTRGQMHRDGIAHDLRQAEQIRQPDHARLPIADGVSDDDLQIARIDHAERVRKAVRTQRGRHPFTASKRARAV